MNTTRAKLNLTWQWELDSDYSGRAYTAKDSVWINGLPMHVVAYRVCQPHAQQHAWQDVFDDEVTALQGLIYSALRTTLLPGLDGEWVISITPQGI